MAGDCPLAYLTVLLRLAELVRAGSSTGPVGDGLAKRTMVGLSVAVVCFGAAIGPMSGVAQADPISSTKAQVSTLQAQVVASAERIRALTLAYEEANTRASALSRQVATDRADMATLQARLDSTRNTLRREAILGYTGAEAVPPAASPGAVEDLAVRAEYLQVAAGDISNVLDQYRTQQFQLATAESALARESAASQTAVAAEASARQMAIAEATSVQNQLTGAQSRLQQLLAARAAAEAAASAAPSSPPSQGLPVNGGLVSVVRNIVSPTPAPAPTVVAAPAPAPAPPPASPAGSSGSSSSSGSAGGVWLQLRECESGDNYQTDTGNGFYGAYQFSEATWSGLGYPGRPDLEPPAMQDQAAQRLQAQSGWGQWPACSAALGLH